MKLWQFEKCVKTPRAHLSKLSKKNFRRCAVVNLWNKNRFKIYFRNKMKTSKFFYTSAKRFQTTFGQNGLFEAEPNNFLSYCMSCPPRWPASGANSQLSQNLFCQDWDFALCQHLSDRMMNWQKWFFSLALLLICHQHLQLDSWGIRSLLLIYLRSADKLRLVFTIWDTDFKGCHPLMWLCTNAHLLKL